MLTDIVHSLKMHGFQNIILIGDSGGNQARHEGGRREAERAVERQPGRRAHPRVLRLQRGRRSSSTSSA